MELFGNKFRNHSTRLKGYDYGANGVYFVTICTLNKVHYFGEIVGTDYCPSLLKTANLIIRTDNNPSLQYTPIGITAKEYWLEIPLHYPYVKLDEFVIMPNHIHGILKLNRPDYASGNPNQFGPQSGTLGAIIRGYKASVKRFANLHKLEFNWQSRFYDIIIKDQQDLWAIKNYIQANLSNWKKDDLNLNNQIFL
jgi:putative transposase